jgi:hypothetical protein
MSGTPVVVFGVKKLGVGPLAFHSILATCATYSSVPPIFTWTGGTNYSSPVTLAVVDYLGPVQVLESLPLRRLEASRSTQSQSWTRCGFLSDDSWAPNTCPAQNMH